MIKNSKAFTLIELIAALVILSIVVLISVPIVLTIKDKAKYNSYKIAIDNYGHALELAVANDLIYKGDISKDLSELNNNYNGSKVECNIMQVKENGKVYLSECKVDNVEVRNSKSSDGWYHYNERDYTNEEYISMYGQSMEKSLKKYMLKNGKMPDDYSELHVESMEKRVNCDVTMRGDKTIYLTNCRVNNAIVLNSSETDGYYHYGKYYDDEDYVDMYGRILEEKIQEYFKKNNSYPTSTIEFDLSFIGKNINCKERIKKNGELYLTECTVDGMEVKDVNTSDGWYHYNDYSDKEYVDLYGEMIEEALKNYYIDNNRYPDNFDELTLDNLDKSIECSISLNWDKSIYMTMCKVNNTYVMDETSDDNYYHYGVYKPYKTIYKTGDEVTYNGVDYYTLKDSKDSEQNVTLLKKEPLSVSEVDNYGAGHVNMNNLSSTNTYYRKAYNQNGYGGMAYNSSSYNSNYLQSDVKYVVDAWASAKTETSDLIEARLIKIDEIRDNLYFEIRYGATYNTYAVTSMTPTWAVDNKYTYWTMTPYNDYSSIVWVVSYYNACTSRNNTRNSYSYVVRPVIVIKKSAITT